MDTPTVFLSYAHEDEEWKNLLLRQLQVLEIEGELSVWNDREIAVGDTWLQEIEDAMSQAAAAVLLISDAFLVSKFIRGQEVPKLLERRAQDGLRLVPVIVSSCPWRNVSWLSAIQCRPKDGNELDRMPLPEAKHCLTAVAVEIADLLGKAGSIAQRARVPETVTSSGQGPQISLTHLPPGTENFVGREAQLRRLDEAWAAREKVNILSLVAFGGVGKTALVNAWIKSLRERNWAGAERVFGWSFYSQGTKDAPASADPFFEAIFDWLAVPPKLIPQAAERKGEKLAELLSQRHTLLILDGLEPLQQAPAEQGGDGPVQDPALAALLRSLVFHNPGLCLITTRVPLAETADYADSTAPRIDLERLGKRAGVALLERYGVGGLQKEKEEAVDALDGHALALTLAGTYLRDFAEGEIGRLKEVPILQGDTKLGQHARRMMAAYEKRLGQGETAVLSLLGLFDRPARDEVLRVLREEPPIPGLTEGITTQQEHAWKAALIPLRNARLIVEEDGTFTTQATLDAHPLVREYFGERLRQGHPDAWQQANDRLYQWYREQAPDLPDTLDEMLPLYQAVVHGCRAGKHQEALDEVFWRRILRGKEHYSWKKLGAFTSELVALAALFERPWGQPAPGLTNADQAFLLNEAAFTLRAVGRLREAVEPLKAQIELSIQQGLPKNAAIGASNLSGLLLTLGDVEEAVTAGRRAVELAEESGDLFQRMVNRTTLADALHQSAPPGSPEGAEAAALFAEAEALQEERQPDYPRLYSLRGYQYCDLLLGDAPERQAAEAARERAQSALKIAESNRWTLDIALDHLTLGRAAFHLALLGEVDFTEAARELDAAVAGLRQAGQMDDLPRGLLARARLYRQLKDWHRAARDLEEVRSIAERGSMRLHLAEYHLEARDLARARGDSKKAEVHEAKARALIEATGYRRKSPRLS